MTPRDPKIRVDSRTTLAQAVATAIAGSIVFILGSLLYIALTDGPAPTPLSLLGLMWQPVIWSILVLACAALARELSVAAVAWWAVALAPIATLIAVLITSGPGLWTSLPAVALVVGWQSIGMLGAAAAGAFLGRRRTTGAARPGSVAVGTATTCLIVGAVAVFALPAQYLQVYFTLWGVVASPSAEDGHRYLVTAIGAITLLIVGLGAAIVARRRALIWLAAIALTVGVLGAYALQVPQGRFTPPPAPPEPVRSGYVPCYGEGIGCEGG